MKNSKYSAVKTNCSSLVTVAWTSVLTVEGRWKTAETEICDNKNFSDFKSPYLRKDVIHYIRYQEKLGYLLYN